MEDLEEREVQVGLEEGKEVPFLMLSPALPETGRGEGQVDQGLLTMSTVEAGGASRGLAALVVKVARPPEPLARAMGRAA